MSLDREQDYAIDAAFTAGIDEAVKQANEELQRTGSDIRFLNAGLNTVCITRFDDPVFIRAEADLARREAALS